MRTVRIWKDGHTYIFRWDGNGEHFMRDAVNKAAADHRTNFDRADAKEAIQALLVKEKKP